MPISATFRLDDEDLAVLGDALGSGVVSKPEITVSRRYNEDSTRWSDPYDSRRAVENLLERANIRKKTIELYKDVKDLDGIEEVCARLGSDESDSQKEKTAEEIASLRAELDKLDGKKTWRVAVDLLKDLSLIHI